MFLQAARRVGALCHFNSDALASADQDPKPARELRLKNGELFFLELARQSRSKQNCQGRWSALPAPCLYCSPKITLPRLKARRIKLRAEFRHIYPQSKPITATQPATLSGLPASDVELAFLR